MGCTNSGQEPKCILIGQFWVNTLKVIGIPAIFHTPTSKDGTVYEQCVPEQWEELEGVTSQVSVMQDGLMDVLRTMLVVWILP